MYFRSMKSDARFVLDQKESDSGWMKRSPVIIIVVGGAVGTC